MKLALSFVAVLSFAGFALVRGAAKGEACDVNNACDPSDSLFCDTTCKVKANSNCTAGDACITGATCSSDKCICDSTKYITKADNTTCLLKVNQTCTDGGCIMGATCTGDAGSKTCKCDTNTAASMDKDKCLNYIGESCTSADYCVTSSNAECKDSKCSCKANYLAVADKSACKAALGQGCSDSGDCYTAHNSECAGTPKKCQCMSGFYKENDRCVKKVGDGCNSTKTTECSSNAECKGSNCTCKADYEKSTDGFCSSTSGSSAVVGSALILLFAFVTSRLL